MILAVGIESLEDVCARLAEKASQKTVVLDVCSVKTVPVSIMKKYLGGKCQLLGTHPLFGPQTVTDNNLAGKKIVLYPIDFINYSVFRMFLESNLRLEIIELDPEAHDREMAWVHALTFYVGRGLMRLDLPKSQLSTAYYQKLIDLVELETSHSIELFNTVELGNPYASEVRQKFVKVLQEIESEIGGRSL